MVQLRNLIAVSAALAVTAVEGKTNTAGILAGLFPLTNTWGGLRVYDPIFQTTLTPDWPLPNPVFGEQTEEDWGTIHVHDPSVIKHNGSYYVFSTHDLVGYGKAPSMYGPWVKQGSVLVNASVIDVGITNTDPWAPDIHKVGDTFYLFYSISTFGSQSSAIGLATSKTLEVGSWTDHGLVIQSSGTASYPYNVSNAIDPNLLVETDSRGKVTSAYLQWGSFWQDIYQIPLTTDLKVPPDAAKKAVHLAYDPVAPSPIEGAYLHKASNGYYYLFVSHGVCCGYSASLPLPGKEYKIVYGRSTSPNGPFLDKEGNKLTEGGGSAIYGSHQYVFGPGGQGVFYDDDAKKDILYYHYVDTRLNLTDSSKLLGWNYLEYTKDGWPYLTN
ncbi:glycosyl hydrolase [Lipomyces japonicus]|uniref:glycosyl hydrolase n=1 Tax=Lipomyces japonicus TaxID=56871 RepID=UPI0034CF6D84